ncbi:MAG: carboxypeptidase-like regulatory domain-containing protein [Pirellulaceae bacterium]
MNITSQINSWLQTGSTSATQADIQDELDFHLESRTQEFIKHGLSPEEAKEMATAAFGDRNAIEKQCRSIQRGAMIWVFPTLLSTLILAILTIGFLAWSVLALQAKNAILLDQNTQFMSASTGGLIAPPEISTSEQDLGGTVVDVDGNAIAGAKIVLVHKSWPNGRFQMNSVTTETLADGRFVFDKVIAVDQKNEFLVTVFAEGFEMRSEYLDTFDKKNATMVDFKLKPVEKISFTFTDSEGNSLPETNILVMSRKSGTKEHLMYPASANQCQFHTDKSGQVTLPFFEKHDIVKFGVLTQTKSAMLMQPLRTKQPKPCC